MPDTQPTIDRCDDALRERLSQLVATQLAEHSAAITGIASVAAGLGSRRFYRLQLSGALRSAIARVDMPEDPGLRPPGIPPEPPLEPIRAHLERAGLPVPRRLAACDGIELLEDFGDRTLESIAAEDDAQQRVAFYECAVDLISALQRAPLDSAVPNYARALDAPLFAYKAEQVCSWLIPCTTGKPATAGEREAVHSAFAVVHDAARSAPQRLAHRDFKAQNLHVLEADDARGRLAMIDIQGAFMAPPEYDAVCLLRDLHIALPEPEVEALLARLQPQLPDSPPERDFMRRFNLLTLSRVGKDLSRFIYAVRERRDERYLAFLPNGVRSLGRAASALAGEPGIANFAQIVAALPENPCAR